MSHFSFRMLRESVITYLIASRSCLSLFSISLAVSLSNVDISSSFFPLVEKEDRY